MAVPERVVVERGSEPTIVVAGGDPVPARAVASLPAGALVIAADSGLDIARSLGLKVDRVVGDLDSVTSTALDEARAAGVTVEQHPTAKDDTDLALALDAAVAAGAERVIVVGGHGGRLDHLVANTLLLASPGYAGVEVVGLLGPARVHVTRTAVVLDGSPGEVVSLLAVHGPVRGITTEGLRYPLHGEDLLPGSTRGVSNEFVQSHATVSLRDGVLLVIQPDAYRDDTETTRP